MISVDPAHDFDHQRVAGHIAQLHGIGPAQACGTNRIVRIEFRQLSGLSATPVGAGGGPVRSIGTVEGPGRLRDRLPRLLGRVAEWQTRWLQVPVSFGTWGFKSPFAHTKPQVIRVTNSEEGVAFVFGPKRLRAAEDVMGPATFRRRTSLPSAASAWMSNVLGWSHLAELCGLAATY